MQSYWELHPQPAATVYVPRIFGFKIHRPQGAPVISAGRTAALAASSASGKGAAAPAGAAGSSSAVAGTSGAAGSDDRTQHADRPSHEGDDGDNERTPGGSKARSNRAGGASAHVEDVADGDAG